MNDVQTKHFFKALAKGLILVVGTLLLSQIPIVVGSHMSSFSLSDYERIIQATEQDEKEHETVTSLPNLTDRELGGEIDERRALEAFNLLYPNENFQAESLMFEVEKKGLGYMYTVTSGEYEYQIIYDKSGAPVARMRIKAFFE